MADAAATLDLADRTGEADQPHSAVVRFASNNPLRLDAGVDFAPLQIAYQTYGMLNAARSNAVLVCHALTGDQHVVNAHPVTGKPGWWETMVGPGRPIDTRTVFRHLRQRGRRLHGLLRPGLDQPGDRHAVGS